MHTKSNPDFKLLDHNRHKQFSAHKHQLRTRVVFMSHHTLLIIQGNIIAAIGLN